MIKRILTTLIFSAAFQMLHGQHTLAFADSIRKVYHIPELGYAVVSSTEVLESAIIGIKKLNTTFTAAPDDKFRIGSNTKAITGFIAAQMVKEKKIN